MELLNFNLKKNINLFFLWLDINDAANLPFSFPKWWLNAIFLWISCKKRFWFECKVIEMPHDEFSEWWKVAEVLIRISFTCVLLCLPSFTASWVQKYELSYFFRVGERNRQRKREKGGGGKTGQRAERRHREKRKTVAVSLTYMNPAQLWPHETPEGSNTLLHFAKPLDIHKLWHMYSRRCAHFKSRKHTKYITCHFQA